jgi:hypothetical protein
MEPAVRARTGTSVRWRFGRCFLGPWCRDHARSREPPPGSSFGDSRPGLAWHVSADRLHRQVGRIGNAAEASHPFQGAGFQGPLERLKTEYSRPEYLPNSSRRLASCATAWRENKTAQSSRTLSFTTASANALQIFVPLSLEEMPRPMPPSEPAQTRGIRPLLRCPRIPLFRRRAIRMEQTRSCGAANQRTHDVELATVHPSGDLADRN